MLHSSRRQLALCGWLKENRRELYEEPLKLQKFLFFYECFAKIKGQPYSFDGLKGYRLGPVFSTVYGDYTKEREAFDICAENTYRENKSLADSGTSGQSAFICSALTAEDLSYVTHRMNLWKSKERRINSGIKQVPLDEADFNSSDMAIAKDLLSLCSWDSSGTAEIIRAGQKRFVFHKKDAEKLTAEHYAALEELKDADGLFNPVFVELDEEGRLVLD